MKFSECVKNAYFFEKNRIVTGGVIKKGATALFITIYWCKSFRQCRRK